MPIGLEAFCLDFPYRVNDAHIAPHLIPDTGDADFVSHQFTYRCAAVAGKFIHRGLGKMRPSSSVKAEVDKELSGMAASMPMEWWKVPTSLSSIESENDSTRTRLQQQFSFFQLRNYVHLPFLTEKSLLQSSDSSKLICIDSAREMLRRFLLYHTVVNGEKLFECKTADFIRSMAATILFIGLSRVQNGFEAGKIGKR